MSTAISVTGEYLQWSDPAEKTTVVSARVQRPTCLKAKTRHAGNQEQYLFFHMMTVQLKERVIQPLLDNRGFSVSGLNWLFPHMVTELRKLMALFIRT